MLNNPPASTSGLAALRHVDLFADVPQPVLATLAGTMQRKLFDAGTVIFLRGDPGTSLYLIHTGRVRIGLSSAGGKEVTLTLLGPGDFFGDLALLDGAPRSADAMAYEACELFVLQRSDFMTQLDRQPQLAKELLSVMSRRLRRNADLIEEVAFLEVGARVARLLVGLADERGIPGATGLTLAGRLTQTDLASLVSATRESVNKCLSAYQREKLLAWDRGRLILLDLAGLRRRAEM